MFSNVLLVDRKVHDHQTFIDSVNATTFPVVFDSNTTKSSILSLLQERFTKIDRIGIVFEGQPHYMFLDSQPLFIPNEISPFSENVQFIIEIIKSFNIENIDYLGCNTLNFPGWKSYYDIIQTNTNAIVGASNDMTGNIQYGGDWVMETTGTDIELIYFTSSIGYYKFLLGNSSNSIVLSSNGDIYGCGWNVHGQLGNGNTSNTTTLVKMINNTGKTPVLVSCGGSHTIVLMTDGSIYGCGYNGEGQLGDGTFDNKSTLTRMTNTTGKTPKSVTCGSSHTIVLMTDGSAYGCGNNYFGQLGNGNTSNTNTSLTQMTIPNGKTATSISSGDNHTIVLMIDGTIFGCGINEVGQLGNGTSTNYNGTPNPTLIQMTNVPSTNGITPTSITCGTRETIVLMSDGTVFGCGQNGVGQLGNGTFTQSLNLTPMTTLPTTNGIKVTSISSGSYHTIVLMSDGSIYVCGWNVHGQLGIGNLTNSSTLTQMLGENGVGFITNIVSIADGRMPPPPPPPPPPCFKEGSLILTIDGYVPIQNLRTGDLVKTLTKGYLPINIIGKKTINNKLSNLPIDRLFVCTNENYPEIFEDLYITGLHSILVDDITKKQHEIITELHNLDRNDIFKTEGKYRLPVFLDEKAHQYGIEEEVTIYHLALDNEDEDNNYGIYANGLLVETTSINLLKDSDMTLLE